MRGKRLKTCLTTANNYFLLNLVTVSSTALKTTNRAEMTLLVDAYMKGKLKTQRPGNTNRGYILYICKESGEVNDYKLLAESSHWCPSSRISTLESILILLPEKDLWWTLNYYFCLVGAKCIMTLKRCKTSKTGGQRRNVRF